MYLAAMHLNTFMHPRVLLGISRDPTVTVRIKLHGSLTGENPFTSSQNDR